MATRFDVTMDCADATVLGPFWRLALGYEDEPPPEPFATHAEWLASLGEQDDDPRDGTWLRDPAGVGPRFVLLRVPEAKVVKNRVHLDLRVAGTGPPAERWARVTTMVRTLKAAGGSAVETVEGHHVVMADPEGNEFCVA